EHPLGGVLVNPVLAACPRDEPLVIRLDLRLRALAAHRSPQALRLPDREPGERDCHLEHLVLEDDRAERLAQHGLERGVLVGNLVVGIDTQALAARDVWIDGAALNRSRPDDRYLDREALEALGTGAVRRLYLRPALALKDA